MKINEEKFAAWMVMGMSFGLILGVIFGNIGIGISMGTSFGIVLAAALSQEKIESKEVLQNKKDK